MRLDCLFVVFTGHMRYFVNSHSTVCSWTLSKFSGAKRASNKRVKNSSISKKVETKYNTMYHFSFEVCLTVCINRTHLYIYRVSQEEWTKLRESVPYVKIYRYNPKHLYPKLNGYGDNGQRSLKL